MSTTNPETPAASALKGKHANRWGLFALIVLCLATYFWVSRPIQTKIPWQHDLAAALVQADAEKKLVFLEFDSKSCVYCRKMDAEIFATAEAAELMTGMIPVRLDRDRYHEEAKRFDVWVLPKFFILSGSGDVLAEAAGALSMEQFRAFLDSATHRR